MNTVENCLGSFLNNTLKDIMVALNAECASLFLFDPKNNDLVLDSFHNSCNLQIKGLRKRIGEGIAGKVVESKIPVLVSNINDDCRFQRNGFNHYHTSSFISIPLFNSQGAPLGLISIADKTNGEAFSEKDLQFSLILAKYACLIIEQLSDKEALGKQRTMLEKYASVGKLAAGIVHEINNPLDGITRYTNILLAQAESKSIYNDYLTEIKKGLNRIANITKSLLEFSHQVNSNHHRVIKYVDTHELIDEMLQLTKDKTNGDIVINKNYKAGLGKIADFGLHHVFINLIKNAIDAMPHGGALSITTEIEDSAVKISFRDTGLGVPAEIIERIFEPFFTTKSIDKGTGLGLAICREIMRNYEGEIKVESNPEKGSLFTVLIPKKYLENA